MKHSAFEKVETAIVMGPATATVVRRHNVLSGRPREVPDTADESEPPNVGATISPNEAKRLWNEAGEDIDSGQSFLRTSFIVWVRYGNKSRSRIFTGLVPEIRKQVYRLKLELLGFI